MVAGGAPARGAGARPRAAAAPCRRYRPLLSGRLRDRRLFDAERFDWDAFRAITPLRRQDLQAGSEAFISRPLAASRDPALSFTTSGSTGMPVTVHWTAEANRLVATALWRYHRWHGSDPAAKSCGLRAVPTDTQGRGRVIRSRGWYPGHSEGESAAADAAQPVRAQLRWLVAEAPRYLLTYPSNARALLTEARESGIGLPTLERIDSFGETMVEGLAELARSVCGARVADRYSAREAGMLAFQCPQGPGYHVQAESVLLEIIDEKGAPVELGESGRVLVTVLHNALMPLIRYEIGDYAEWGEPCPCGRGLPTIRRICGRQRNMLLLPDGDRLWPRFNSDDFAKAVPVRQFQLVQRSLAEIEVTLVPLRTVTPAEEAALERMIRERLKGEFRLRFRYVDAIPRGPGGKYEDFRSEIAG